MSISFSFSLILILSPSDTQRHTHNLRLNEDPLKCLKLGNYLVSLSFRKTIVGDVWDLKFEVGLQEL